MADFIAAVHGLSYQEIRGKFGVSKGAFYRMVTKAKGCVELHTDSRESATPLQDINELRTLLQAKSEALIEDLA